MLFSIFNNKRRTFKRKLAKAARAVQLLSSGPFMASLESQKLAKSDLLDINIWWQNNVSDYKSDSSISVEEFELMRKCLQLPDIGKYRNKHGKIVTYYDNGQIEYEWNYQNGYKHGIQRGWFQNGVLSFEQNYIFDHMDGLQKGWYENGNLQSEDNYRFETPNDSCLSSSCGWQRKYRDNGTIQEERFYNEETFKHEKTLWYHDSGIIKEIREVSNKVIHCREFDNNGCLVNEWTR